MTPGNRRRILCAAIVLTTGTILYASKARAEEPVIRLNGYSWQFRPDAPICHSVQWVQLKPHQIPGVCGSVAAGGVSATENTSCAIGCAVFSPFSEVEAQWAISGNMQEGTESVYAHESRHVLERLRHPGGR